MESLSKTPENDDENFVLIRDAAKSVAKEFIMRAYANDVLTMDETSALIAELGLVEA